MSIAAKGRPDGQRGGKTSCPMSGAEFGENYERLIAGASFVPQWFLFVSYRLGVLGYLRAPGDLRRQSGPGRPTRRAAVGAREHLCVRR
ncbi:hypothetical protein GCM10010234_68120 [Streptomyces hawaiiensis]